MYCQLPLTLTQLNTSILMLSVMYTSTDMYGIHTRVQKHTRACTELQLQYVAQGQRNYIR